ncbi:E3 ubiquitin-protein ligase LRSAM1-like [Leguminivora glycinivorella]|uniref:E3 ubiquitin-protein ligase LRSAM1-like n=1 Tax=Leguminivora glycinivorella TaxID=1035111 RepID=UPI002010396B|nr:E3 ubiquitin-protein ligase LRSAM1-like [Leguminivora glycinivorella]
MAENFANCHARRQAQLNGAARPTRRNREAQLVRATAVNNNMRALEAGIITLRYFLVAVSARINVGEVVADPDVPEMAEEIEVADWDEEVPDAEVEVLLPPAPPAAPAPAPPAAPSPPAPAPAATRCGICLEQPPTRVLIPCGHVLCDPCLVGVQQASGANRCPYCRSHIGSCINIYL